MSAAFEAGGVRLQKVLAAAGVASRRACEIMISEGRVEVNGRLVVEQGTRVDPDRDVISRFPEDERGAMRNDEGLIVVDCAFCSRTFPIRD